MGILSSRAQVKIQSFLKLSPTPTSPLAQMTHLTLSPILTAFSLTTLFFIYRYAGWLFRPLSAFYHRNDVTHGGLGSAITICWLFQLLNGHDTSHISSQPVDKNQSHGSNLTARKLGNAKEFTNIW